VLGDLAAAAGEAAPRRPEPSGSSPRAARRTLA
jgi:hypothetical protein